MADFIEDGGTKKKNKGFLKSFLEGFKPTAERAGATKSQRARARKTAPKKKFLDPGK